MNNQQIDKIVNFFRINYHFHDPYKLLIDGNFIKILVQKQINLQKKFQNATKGKVSIRVTTCILRQLQLLGDQFRLVYNAAKTYKQINCKHSLQTTVDKCILDQIGENNQKMLFICSQDLQLRRQLRFYHNVPLIYFGPDQRITMEDIHKYSLKYLQIQNKKKFLPQENQMEQVNQLKKQNQRQQKLKKIKQIQSQMGIKVKTKIAKAPNPLSIKKKHKTIIKNRQENDQKVKRKRIRKKKQNKSQYKD